MPGYCWLDSQTQWLENYDVLFHFDLASHRPILLPRRPLRSYYVKYVLHHVYQVVDGCYQFGARYTLKHILVAMISHKTHT